jgi:hypothetical protein
MKTSKILTEYNQLNVQPISVGMGSSNMPLDPFILTHTQDVSQVDPLNLLDKKSTDINQPQGTFHNPA